MEDLPMNDYEAKKEDCIHALGILCSQTMTVTDIIKTAETLAANMESENIKTDAREMTIEAMHYIIFKRD